MDSILSLLGAGLLEAMQPLNLTMIVIGCTVGLLVGAMPGLCLLYTSPSPRDGLLSRMPSSA